MRGPISLHFHSLHKPPPMAGLRAPSEVVYVGQLRVHKVSVHFFVVQSDRIRAVAVVRQREAPSVAEDELAKVQSRLR
jgi:hypothetical protein